MEMNDYNVTINARHFFDQTIKNDLRTFGNGSTEKLQQVKVMITKLNVY